MKNRLEQRGKLGHFDLEEVLGHSTPESAWIVVDGFVYDITSHVRNHAGWKCGCSVSELLAILRALGEFVGCFACLLERIFPPQIADPFNLPPAGTDCTDEFLEVHSKQAVAKLQPYMLGTVAATRETENKETNTAH